MAAATYNKATAEAAAATDGDEETKRKIEIVEVQGDDDVMTCATFVVHDEDHTLGNSLRYIISKNEDVDFCGYTIPHPSEEKFNLRIQTKTNSGNSFNSGRDTVSAIDVLRQGATDMQDICNHMLKCLDIAVLEFDDQVVNVSRG